MASPQHRCYRGPVVNARKRQHAEVMTNILLVEDDDNDVVLMKRALRRAGVVCPIEIAEDGRKALDYLQSKGRFCSRDEHPMPSLVLLDLKLPHVMGLDVLQWIRRQDQFTSMIVIVLSASRSPDDLANAVRYGANDYLVKPSTLDELDTVAQTIRDWCLNGNHLPQWSPDRMDIRVLATQFS
jgi:CheY-like chemotaxis protein